MDIILCHQTADFDALGAAVGLSKLRPGSRIVLTGGTHPGVKEFLALYRDELALIEMRSVNPEKIRSLMIVDNQYRDRLGKASQWLDLPQLTHIELYDHHLASRGEIHANIQQVEAVGATTTLITEKFYETESSLTAIEASVMALGIHVDTGSLTFPQTTPRDAKALAWLMEQGAKVKIIADYADPGFSPLLQKLFGEALENLESTEYLGFRIASVLLQTPNFVAGLSTLTERLMEIIEADALLLGHYYHQRRDHEPYPEGRFTVIGRTGIEGTSLNRLFNPLGGGGHHQAASLNVRGVDPERLLAQLKADLIAQIPHPLTARDLMSSPVRTIRPQTTIEQAQRILFRYGHSGLSVVDDQEQLVGVISRRDLDLALHHGFSHAPVKGYMARNVKVIGPETLLPEIEAIMVTFDVGRLPVVDQGKLIGIVTRTDVLRQLHQERENLHHPTSKAPLLSCLLPNFRERLQPELWQLLEQAGQVATAQGWHLYLVGGAVRDLLLREGDEKLFLQDIDLVVDGFHQTAEAEAGVQLARLLQAFYPQARLSVHGSFQTAALLWHRDPVLGSLWVDIATARTEFYPYPAANPVVEASSIRQDLYRRDFTINALALRLTSPRQGELLDFFGGMLDLRSRQVRVLHANSFIEDPTRIYRAVRFAVRLGFDIEPQTESYIRYGIESGVYERLRLEKQVAPALTTRLKAELKVILASSYWQVALKLLADLGALKCLHGQCQLDKALWGQLRCGSRWLTLLDPDHQTEHWLGRLVILLAALPEQDGAVIAAHLQLPQTHIELLRHFPTDEAQIHHQLANAQLPSQVFLALRPYALTLLVAIAARSPKTYRRLIWQYLTQLSHIKSPLTGEDLKALGYKPGPQFKHILEHLQLAHLDGELGHHLDPEATRQSAITYVQTHFPP